MNSPQAGVSTSFRQAGEFAVRSVAGETILVPVRSGFADLECVYTMNDVGRSIWSLLESPRTEDEIVAAVVEEFEVDPSEARKDVADFLDGMKEAGIVRLEERA